MEKSYTMATRERTVRGRRFSDRFIAGVLRVFSRVHIILYRWTGGIIGERIFGNRMLLLTTTGRKTGQPRTKPVGYLTDGDALVIVAGAAGAAKHPDWWLNLESHPVAQVQVGRRRLRVSATRALPEEQQRLWARYPAQYALFESMQKRVSREIPVVILRPVSEPSLAHEKPVRSTAAHKPPVVRVINRAAHTLLRAVTRRLNLLMLSLAGSRRLPTFAVIHHRGRRSGRSYTTPETQKQMLIRFQQALQAGEMTPFMNLLAEDVTFWADGGGKAKGVAIHELFGRDEVARFILSNSPIFRNSLPADSHVELAQVNGQPALITRSGERAFAVLSIDVEADRIQAIRFVANPEKLAHI